MPCRDDFIVETAHAKNRGGKALIGFTSGKLAEFFLSRVKALDVK